MKRRIVHVIIGMVMLFLCIEFNAQVALAATPPKGGDNPPPQQGQQAPPKEGQQQAPKKQEPAVKLINTVNVKVNSTTKNGLTVPSVSASATGASVSKSISWDTAQTKWVPGKTYTGTIELKSKSGYEFKNPININSTGKLADAVSVRVIRNSSTSVTVKVSYTVPVPREPAGGSVRFNSYDGKRLSWNGTGDSVSFNVSIKMVDGTVLFTMSTNNNYLDIGALPHFDNKQNLYFEVQQDGKEDVSRLYWYELDL